ncbi:hypothetical protein VTL71DRAFT_16294, partial [Oculimacula yallundae]
MIDYYEADSELPDASNDVFTFVGVSQVWRDERREKTKSYRVYKAGPTFDVSSLLILSTGFDPQKQVGESAAIEFWQVDSIIPYRGQGQVSLPRPIILHPPPTRTYGN